MHLELLALRLLLILTIAVLLAVMSGGTSVGYAAEPRDLAVALSATIQRTPPGLVLALPAVPGDGQYIISRRVLGQGAWAEVARVATTAESYLDTSVQVGVTYEYQVLMTQATQNPARNGIPSGYLCAGINVPLVDRQGAVVLVVEKGCATALQPELNRLRADLYGDGWLMRRIDVAHDAPASEVKASIKAIYDADPVGVKAVLLLGAVPIPRSGFLNPDGHEQRPWPTDAYYGDMTGAWTDTQTFATKNIPGDGIFDQNTLPGDVTLMVGRVDMSDLPAFAPDDEITLLRRYLDKDHNYRCGNMPAEGAFICDKFGYFNGEAFSQSGWRNFPALVGQAVTRSGEWNEVTGAQQRFLWAYGCGPGSHTSCGGVTDTGNLAHNAPKAVFTLMFGSYFGEWNSTNNLMRAMLATADSTLSCAWAGRPNWFVHAMAMGYPIGYTALVTQNNAPRFGTERIWESYQPGNGGLRTVHIALLGDPTLREHVVLPPANLTAVRQKKELRLSWEASPAPKAGYLVYRVTTPDTPPERLTLTPIAATSFVDKKPGNGTPRYMVRAIVLQQSTGGTYYNASQGIFSPAP